jgi:hypothetical protein
MRHHLVVVVALLVGLIIALPSMNRAQETKKGTEMKVKTVKARFLIEAKHTPEDCLKTLDEVNAQGSKTLSKFDWGCMSGDHTGYAIVEAEDEAAVKAMLPASLQNAHIVRLEKFTPEQIKEFHQKKG